MLRFTRNKVVGVERKDTDTLVAHGILDDHIYSLQMDVSVRVADQEILAVDGRWNRWTTPECPRAVDFLREAVGLRIGEEGFSQRVHKMIGRKACRHYANLLLECCHSVREAALLARWQDEKDKDQDLSFEEFLKGDPKHTPEASPVTVPSPEEAARDSGPEEDPVAKKARSGGMIIDLHVHTSPASPCSSAPVDRLIEEAKRIGLDAICLTDHNYVWDPRQVEDLRQKHGFLILRGNEITTAQGDMIVYGLEDDIQGIVKLEDLRPEVVNAGGFMIVAHPFRGFLTFGVGQLGLTPQKAMERPLFKMVDAIEVLNGKVTEKENSFASEVAAGLGLPATGGSDAHEVSEVGTYATRFTGVIKDENDLVQALKEGNYSPITHRNKKGKEEE
jgi:predicted metal-dependent phosphoesterase TrpH